MLMLSPSLHPDFSANSQGRLTAAVEGIAVSAFILFPSTLHEVGSK